MKKTISLFIVSSLVATLALSADFSKKSNDEILNLAKSVTAQDQADLMIEMRKRMSEMKYNDAQEYHYQFRNNLRQNISKLNPEERIQRRAIVQQNMQDITDKMNGKEIRELNLHHRGYSKGMHHRGYHFQAQPYDCPMR
ncbi:hypothetical protein A7X81_07510 [Campylobacter ornithocola]|uniref:Uncharacterized protein n=1 Tax=Campylobacter ornithocola TaxID=1848766 RepID=A0A6M8MWN2_9BACT|nr:DUF1104 domain-containing protein [Campylobacter ornithocola]OCX43048.1 hypothetical protein A7X81_07510 [Campylobacter ornithocola]QKF56699.1 DUF1104 domain-containing protein [Campylobacter ornithocola]